jgi:hypothetical protein
MTENTSKENKISVTLTNVPERFDRTTSDVMLTIDEKSIKKFLKKMMSARVYYDSGLYNTNHFCTFSVSTVKQTETIIEIPDFPVQPTAEESVQELKNVKITMKPHRHSAKCGCQSAHDCPKYVAAGRCTSPFVRKYIGKILLMDRYIKQK